MFLEAREAIHAALEALLKAKLVHCDVERNTGIPTDWDSMTHDRKVIIRDGRFRRDRVTTGNAMWTFLPRIEGHVRASSAAELGALSNALLGEVCTALEEDLTLGGACDDLEFEMSEDGMDLNTEPEAGPLLAWELVVAAELEQRTDS